MLQQLPTSLEGVTQQAHKSGQKMAAIVVDLVEKVIFLCFKLAKALERRLTIRVCHHLWTAFVWKLLFSPAGKAVTHGGCLAAQLGGWGHPACLLRELQNSYKQHLTSLTKSHQRCRMEVMPV